MKSLKENPNIQDNVTATIPYFVHEADMARLSKTNELLMTVNKRAHILNIIYLFVILVVIISAFIYTRQFEKVTETTETYEAIADGDSIAFNNGSGEVIYGGDSKIHEND